jgi:hypothetical protein
MPAVAEVQFKAVNSQQVVTAFKSVGDAAATGTTKIQQNSSAIKSVGTGMKGAVSSVGALATSFATLSLSIVNTWRSYRDLEDTQIAVNTATIKLTNATQKLNDLKGKAKTLSTQESKGNTKNVLEKAKIRVAQENLAKAEKEGKKTKNELRLMQAALNDMIAEANKTNPEYEKTLREIKDQEDIVANSKLKLGEAQEAANDAVQDFYLSIAPTAIGVIGSMATVVGTLNSSFGGPGKGLIGGIGGLGLVLGAAGLAVVAYQNNWFGLKDAIGGVIEWIKSRFEVWQKTVSEVFGLITKGDWAGAFNKIKAAAAAFWADLQKAVPLFKAVDTIVNAIANGNWEYAFSTIKAEAELMWFQLKEAVPLFGTIETVINQITKGDWEGAFKTIGDSIMKGLAAIGGEKWVLKWQLMRDTAIAEFNLLMNTLTKPGGPIDLINQGLAKLGKGDIIGGFTTIGAGIKTALATISATINSWVLTNFGVDLASIASQANVIGTKILDGIKSGLTFVARTWIDPIIVALLDPATWTAAILALGGAVVSIGTAIFNAIAGAITAAAEDPKGAASWWEGIGTAIWSGITTWFTANLPGATEVMKSIAQSLTDAAASTSIAFQNVGRTIWNSIVEGLKAFSPQFAAAFDKIKLPMLEPEVKPKLNDQALISTWAKNVKNIEGTKIIPKVQANTQPFTSITNKAIQNAQSREARIRVTADVRAFNNAVANLSRAARIPIRAHQHGYQSTVKRPTMFLAGEGGRPEDVTVRPRGSVQRGGAGGGGSTHITISFEPQEFAQFIRYRINDNQGVVK